MLSDDHGSLGRSCNLKSMQEEADTHLLLHASHAADEGYSSVVITAEDTDVLMLSHSFSKRSWKTSCPMYQKSGTQNQTTYIDIGKLATSLGDGVWQALVGLHAFTGYDTVSAFADRGKLGALKLLKGSEAFQEAFKDLWEEWGISEEVFSEMQKFTIKMYVLSSSTMLGNTLRYDLFCAKRGEVESSQLPPCTNCLKQYVWRADYQAVVWQRSLVSQPVIPDPTGFEWSADPGTSS